MLEPTPLTGLTEEWLEDMRRWAIGHPWTQNGGPLLALVAEVRRLRAERAEVAGLITRVWPSMKFGKAWLRLCELFPELKERP